MNLLQISDCECVLKHARVKMKGILWAKVTHCFVEIATYSSRTTHTHTCTVWGVAMRVGYVTNVDKVCNVYFYLLHALYHLFWNCRNYRASESLTGRLSFPHSTALFLVNVNTVQSHQLIKPHTGRVQQWKRDTWTDFALPWPEVTGAAPSRLAGNWKTFGSHAVKW